MKVAPIGAFGAMAFTIGKYGVGSLLVARQADGDLLPDLPGVHLRRARHHRARCTASASGKFIALHQGRAADRARHLVVGVGAAAHDGQAGEPGRAQVGRRPGHPDRLLVQPRRHLDLPDDGGGVHRPGDQHAADADAADHAAGGAAADLEGRGRRDRQRLHRAGRDALGGRQRAGRRPGADPRHRPLHVRGARAHQPDRQRRRDGRRRPSGPATSTRRACRRQLDAETATAAEEPEAILDETRAPFPAAPGAPAR